MMIYVPRRLNRLVKVLPQPGTGQTKWASFLLRLADAACVALVVTCCFSTWRMGGRRGVEPLAYMAEAARMSFAVARPAEPAAAAAAAAAMAVAWL